MADPQAELTIATTSHSATTPTVLSAKPPLHPLPGKPTPCPRARLGSAPPPLADPQPDEGALERGPGALLVGHGDRTSREDLLRPLPGLLGAPQIDLLGMLGDIRQDHHVVAADVHKTPEYGQNLLDAAPLDPKHTRPERGKERRMVREDPDVALARRRDDHVHVLLVDAALRRDDLEMKWHHEAAARVAAFSRASSTVPTM